METSLRQSRTGSVVVCVAPSPARGNLRHDQPIRVVGLAMCLAGVGHTPIPSHPPLHQIPRLCATPPPPRTPPSQIKVTIVGKMKKRNLQHGKSEWAIFGTQVFGSQAPSLPPTAPSNSGLVRVGLWCRAPVRGNALRETTHDVASSGRSPLHLLPAAGGPRGVHASWRLGPVEDMSTCGGHKEEWLPICPALQLLCC